MAKRKSTTKPEPTIRTRGVEVRANSWNEDDRTATVVISTETPVRMGEYEEVLLQKGAQYPAKVPFLDSHNRWEIADHIGSVTNIRLEDGVMLGDVRLARTEGGDMAAALIADGHLTDVSVGYRIDDETFIRAGETVEEDGKTYEGPMYLVKKWRVMEVSAVSIGADPMAKIRAQEAGDPEASNDSDNTTPAEPEEERAMADPKVEPAKPEIDLEKERAAAAEAERVRVREIRDTGRAVGVDNALIDECIDKGMAVADANKRFLDVFKAEHKPAPSQVELTRDQHDTTVRGIEAGIQLRAGLKVDENDKQIAREYAGASLVDMARLFLQSRGESRLPHSHEELLGLAFDARRARRKLRLQGIETRALATSDFPSLLANVANKALAVAYQEQRATYQFWTRLVSVPDFKSRSVPQLSAVADLELVPEGAPITNSSLSDRAESYAIGTYSKIIPLTRQALVNDDLSAFTRLPAMAGAAARRTVNKSVYAILNAGATSAWNMSDGNPLFDTSNHANYGTTGTALSGTTLNLAIAAMMNQTGLAGEIINVEPSYLIVPPSLKQTAEELMFSSAKVAATFSSGVVNTFQSAMSLVVDANLDVVGGGSASAWYLAAAPTTIDTIEVGFLNGVDSPTLEEQDDFDSFGTRWRVFIDFGVKPIDWRGLVKRTGQA